jgi:TonB family protein
LYLFRFLLPDSAVLKYRYLVNQLPQSKYADQALYSLGFISMEIHKDPAGADTSFKMLVQVLAPKAIYTMAWIGENRLDSLNLSFALYDTLIHQYPKTEYAKKVKKKVDYVIAEKQKAIDDQEKKENENLQELNAKEQEVQIKDKDKEEIRGKSERDAEESSVRRIEKTEESDSIQALPVGGISAITKQLAKAGILKKHPFSGVVIVEVYVDAKGKVTKTEFEQSSNIKEVDQAVANIIRGIQFQPAKKGGKSVLSTTVLTIPIGVLE